MRNALIAALVAAIVAASTGTAATMSLMDRVQNQRIAKLTKTISTLDTQNKALNKAQNERLFSLEFRFDGTTPTIQQIYQRAYGCLGGTTGVVVRPDGTLAIPATGEAPTAELATRDTIRCY